MNDSGRSPYDLRSYEMFEKKSIFLSEALFAVIFVMVVTTAILVGLYMKTIKPLPIVFSEKIEEIKAQFLLEEEKKVVPKPEKKPEEEKPAEPEVEKEPVDLTKKIEELPPEESPAEKPPETVEPEKVRKIYGLRKVYSQGLGAQGGASDAVVGKLGNTLNKEYDTITATQQELRGTVVSATTVTAAPRFLKVVKPEYSQEMVDNKIEGVIQVRVLVDIDGKVKKAIALNDLGYGSAQQAVTACFSLLFEPAKRGDESVAVWIIVPIRFVLLG